MLLLFLLRVAGTSVARVVPTRRRILLLLRVLLSVSLLRIPASTLEAPGRVEAALPALAMSSSVLLLPRRVFERRGPLAVGRVGESVDPVYFGKARAGVRAENDGRLGRRETAYRGCCTASPTCWMRLSEGRAAWTGEARTRPANRAGGGETLGLELLLARGGKATASGVDETLLQSQERKKETEGKKKMSREGTRDHFLQGSIWSREFWSFPLSYPVF